MESKVFKVGDTVYFLEEMGGLPAGTIATISNAGGKAPLDMTTRPDWQYTVTLPDNRAYSAIHRFLSYASREGRLKSLHERLTELDKLSKKASHELEMVEKYKDDADFLAHKMNDIINVDAKKFGFVLSKTHIEAMRQEILKMYPSKYKFTE
jgi:hypothetical protein